jgi:hypothetical protein
MGKWNSGKMEYWVSKAVDDLILISHLNPNPITSINLNLIALQ